MIFDLRDIKKRGKDSLDFFFEYSPEKELSSESFLQLVNPVKVSGTVTLSGEHGAFVECNVCFKIKGSCTRCLKETEKEFSVEVRELCEEGETDGYEIVHDRLDMSKIVEDAVIMNLPVSFLCREDCLGLCNQCGANLNDGECKCKNS